MKRVCVDLITIKCLQIVFQAINLVVHTHVDRERDRQRRFRACICVNVNVFLCIVCLWEHIHESEEF